MDGIFFVISDWSFSLFVFNVLGVDFDSALLFTLQT